jgi:hypothetical protein
VVDFENDKHGVHNDTIIERIEVVIAKLTQGRSCTRPFSLHPIQVIPDEIQDETK